MDRDQVFSTMLSLSEEQLASLKEALADRHSSQRELHSEASSAQALRDELFLEKDSSILVNLRGFLSSIVDNSIIFFKKIISRHTTSVQPLKDVFDESWYLATYPDVADYEQGSWHHFTEFGIVEGRRPNEFFDPDWYLSTYTDVRNAGIPGIIHYVRYGASELRNPNPAFNATWYAFEHPDAKENPLLYHLRTGRHRHYPTQPESYVKSSSDIELTSDDQTANSDGTQSVAISVVIPVYKGLRESKECLESVLADTERRPNEIIVIDDSSPEPELSLWLESLSDQGLVRLIRNTENIGFVASVNRGMIAAGTNDVVLLNSDTVVPSGWLVRMQRHAYSSDRIGTVTPFSNNATICSYPSATGGDLPSRYLVQELDDAARYANSNRSVTIPTAVGFAMYIRRACLDEVGLFDHQTFGLGYGEENDFSLRAIRHGWSNVLACDTFVYHKGEVSFGEDSPRKQRAFEILKRMHPNYTRDLLDFASRDPVSVYRFAITAELIKREGRDVILLITHSLGGGTERHVQEIVSSCKATTEFLILRGTRQGCELSVPGIQDHAKLLFSSHEAQKLMNVLGEFNLKRIHIHHFLDFPFDIRLVVRGLGVPFEFTVHDYATLCPRINMIEPATGGYCGEAPEAVCNECIVSSPPPYIAAKNIFAHRWKYDWLLSDANRIICPSNDVRSRLLRFGIAEKLAVVPHEVQNSTKSSFVRGDSLSRPLRVAILGTLAPHKGLATVMRTVIESKGRNIEFVLIGATTPKWRLPRSVRFRETGEYTEEHLESLIRDVAPDVFWFPAVWPETYSYTLTSALNSGLPIVAANLGAFPERLANHPRSTCVPFWASPSEWLEALESFQEQSSKAGEMFDLAE